MATVEATNTSIAQPASTLNLVTSACAHKGRLVVFLSQGGFLAFRASERANDGSWSPYQVAAGGLGHYDLAESVILI